MTAVPAHLHRLNNPGNLVCGVLDEERCRPVVDGHTGTTTPTAAPATAPRPAPTAAVHRGEPAAASTTAAAAASATPATTSAATAAKPAISGRLFNGGDRLLQPRLGSLDLAEQLRHQRHDGLLVRCARGSFESGHQFLGEMGVILGHCVS